MELLPLLFAIYMALEYINNAKKDEGLITIDVANVLIVFMLSWLLPIVMLIFLIIGTLVDISKK